MGNTNVVGVFDDFKQQSPREAGLKDLKQIYNFDQTKILGSGKFGKVYLAQSKFNPDHKVAIKVLKADSARKIEQI
jgi:serine/threonine protein kinase